MWHWVPVLWATVVNSERIQEEESTLLSEAQKMKRPSTKFQEVKHQGTLNYMNLNESFQISLIEQ